MSGNPSHGTKHPADARPRKPRKAHRLKIEVVVRSARWRNQPKAGTIVKSAILAAAEAVSTPPAELAIVLCDDSAIRALNRKWRGQNAPTNVLSFPAPTFLPPPLAGEGRGGGKRKNRPPPDMLRKSTSPASGGGKKMRGRSASPYIGDIVIAFETTAREAVAEGKPLKHHLAHLAIHGFLHLLGYDHESDLNAQTMERLERRILKRIAIPDPYAPPDAQARYAAKT